MSHNQVDSVYRDPRRNVEINVGKVCNNKCVFCLDGQPSKEDHAFMPFDSMKSELERWRAEGGGPFRPSALGVHFLLAGNDTIGGLAVNVDARESQLAPIPGEQLRELWPGARLVDPGEVSDLVFQAAARGDLRGPLLWLALLIGLAEAGLASAWRRER